MNTILSLVNSSKKELVVFASFVLFISNIAFAEQDKFVSGRNVEQYSSTVFEPIYNWTKDSKFAFFVAEKLSYNLPSDVAKDLASRSYRFEFSWHGKRKLIRRASASFLRSNETGEGLLSREIFSFDSPAILDGYSLHTHRYADKKDHSWVFSSLNKKLRRVSYLNRSDSVLDSVFSLDDMFVFSGNPLGYEQKHLETKQMLLPFPSLKLYQSASRAGFSPGVSWNYGNRRFRRSVSWLPTNIYFVEREVAVYQYLPKDALNSFGRQLVFVDLETALPFYKIIYGRDGKQKKVVIGSWGFFQNNKSSEIEPFLAFLISVSSDTRKATVLSTEWLGSPQGLEKKLLYPIPQKDGPS